MSRLNPYIVTPVILQSADNKGERLPMTLHRASRAPVVKHNEWVLAKRRGQVASNTIERELRALTHTQVWLDEHEMSLDAPFDLIEKLVPGRIQASLRPFLAKDQSDRSVKKIAVGPEQIAERLSVASRVIDWVLEDAQRAISVQFAPEKCIAFEDARRSIRKVFADVMPAQASSEKKTGLSRTDTQRLLEFVRPENPENVWGRGFADQADSIRFRNELIVNLGVAYGPRRGDLLKLYTTDVKTHGAEPTLWIRRRPNDPNDPRRWEPNAKTLERQLPLDESLTSKLDEFILKWRKLIPGHKRTPYLFLGTSGMPLSTRSFGEIFEALKPSFPGIHSHKLRHTHNDRLLERCRELGLSHDEYLTHALFLNGWASDNTAIYTERSKREAAQKLSRDVQRQIFAATEDVPF